MFKVVTPEEIRRIEKKAFTQGFSEKAFVRSAGASLSYLVDKFIKKENLSKMIFLLVGKGNNGADALSTGLLLLQRGYIVSALFLFKEEECAPLVQKLFKEFITCGGVINHTLPQEGILIDGIFGTGFKGEIPPSIQSWIEKANHSSLPLLSIDIPSGLNGLTGEVESVALKASETYTLTFPKVGFFKNEGWNYIGKVKEASFGLTKELQEEVNPAALLFEEESVLLPPLSKTQNKYQRGYVVAIAGSRAMPGAAHLAVKAAYRSGAGLVRLFSLDSQPCMDEVIREHIDFKDLTSLLHALEKASSIFIGPGLGRDPSVQMLLQKIAPHLKAPLVLDADALFFFDHYKNLLPSSSFILTPHHGEFNRLSPSSSIYEEAFSYATKQKCILILKGAPTWIYYPNSTPHIINHGDPGMATGGSGDVLTGILAGLLATGLSLEEASSLAVFIHARAGEKGAKKIGSRSLIASDIIEEIPEILKTF